MQCNSPFYDVFLLILGNGHHRSDSCILTLTTLCGPVGALTPQVKYVHPSNNSTSCIVSEPCTFDQYVNDPEQHFLSNTTFIFFPGEHTLSNSLSLDNIKSIVFQGMLAGGSVAIRLGPNVSLTFSDCVGVEMKSLNFLLSGDYEYRLMFYNTSSASLQNIVISTEDEDSTGSSAILSQASVMNISNSRFVEIRGQFGAVLRALKSSNITIMGTNTFVNNSAKLGGAMHSISSRLQFYGMSIFTDNTAHSNVYYDNGDYDSGIGGAVYADNSQVIVKGCANFTSNTATFQGGAVAAMNNSTLVINGSSCSSNGHSPGTMGIEFNSNSCQIEAENSYNYGIGSGGAIYTNSSEVKIGNTSFLNNFSPKSGGAAQFFQSNVTLYNINAANNVAKTSFGGAIRFYSATQTHIDGENRFVNNSANEYGGAIEFCDVQSVIITGVSYFEGNSAENGGAFDLYGTRIAACAFISGDIIFMNNNATNGGAIYVYNSMLNSTGSMEYKAT